MIVLRQILHIMKYKIGHTSCPGFTSPYGMIRGPVRPLRSGRDVPAIEHHRNVDRHKGLLDEVVRPCLQERRSHVQGAHPDDHDKGRLDGPEPPYELDAVYSRHLEIGDDVVIVPVHSGQEPGVTVIAEGHVHIIGAQGVLQPIPYLFVVIDDQHIGLVMHADLPR